MLGVVVPADGRQLIWKHLWGADVGVVMRDYFFKVDPDGSKLGHLPKMALVSKGMMGATLALVPPESSFLVGLYGATRSWNVYPFRLSPGVP